VSSFDEHAVLSALRRAGVRDCPSRKAIDDWAVRRHRWTPLNLRGSGTRSRPERLL